MREIKFRGKDANGKWFFGDLHQWNNGEVYIGVHDDSWTDDGLHSQSYPTFQEINPDTVGQFTGLLDKNGKEIYEGDILHVIEYENIGFVELTSEEIEIFTIDELKGKIIDEYTTPIEFEEGAFLMSSSSEEKNHNDTFFNALFGDMHHSHPIFDFEVIGNIYDNLELLKGGKQ